MGEGRQEGRQRSRRLRRVARATTYDNSAGISHVTMPVSVFEKYSRCCDSSWGE